MFSKIAALPVARNALKKSFRQIGSLTEVLAAQVPLKQVSFHRIFLAKGFPFILLKMFQLTIFY